MYKIYIKNQEQNNNKKHIVVFYMKFLLIIIIDKINFIFALRLVETAV